MTLFIALAVLVIGLAVLILTLSILRSPTASSANQSQSNLLILQESLDSLEKEFQEGLITQEQYAFQKAEIEQRTIDDVVRVKEKSAPKQHQGRWLAYGLITCVPLAVVGIYLLLGNPAALFIAKDPQVQQIQEMVSQLEKKLQAEPSNVDGWMFLGRSYAAMNRLTEAKMAYQKAIALDPKNDNLLADLADLTAFQSKSINAEALEYLNQALTINPKNPKALALRGSAAFDQKNYAAAIKDWTLAVAVLDPKDQEFISGLKNSIQEAQDLLKKNNSSVTTKMSSDILAGKVSVTGKLLTQVSPTDTVFIYARAANGPRMPLAIIRFTANELPRSFELNDSQAMSPQMSLSKFNTLTIIARISKSGNATPQTGDLIGEIENVPLGTKNITLVIDKIQP